MNLNEEIQQQLPANTLSLNQNQNRNSPKIKLPKNLIIYKYLISYISLIIEIRELNIESFNNYVDNGPVKVLYFFSLFFLL
jgi:hypothetical protein